MKVAVMTDVHGNLPALEAALNVIQTEKCDYIYHTGDAIGIGPFPLECLELSLKNNVRMIMGNHEEYYAFGIPNPKPSYMSDGELEHQLWVSSILGPKYKKIVALFPYTINECFLDFNVVFSHYAFKPGMNEFTEIEKSPNKEMMDQMFAEVDTDLIFYGHNHSFSDIAGRRRYVNPGSLGCSSDIALSRFVIIDFHKGSYELRHFSIPYDDNCLFSALEERQVPDRDMIRNIFFRRAL